MMAPAEKRPTPGKRAAPAVTPTTTRKPIGAAKAATTGAARSKPAARPASSTRPKTTGTAAARQVHRAAPAPRRRSGPTIRRGRPRRALTIFGIALAVFPALAVVGLLAWSGVNWASDEAREARDAAALDGVAPLAGDEAIAVGPISPVTIIPDAAKLDTASQGAVSAVSPGGLAATVDALWLAQIGTATGIPERALAAYAGASLVLAAENPACNLGWTTLAGIGRIETIHGSHGGSVLGVDGYPNPAIRGPALNGGQFKGIPDSDGGRWDGDTEWDRAVGPMQFIPQTWDTWGADGNGDGVADPNQIDDAALAAGRYLCHSGDLSSVNGWRAAIFSYNHDNAYVDSVADAANRYATASTS